MKSLFLRPALLTLLIALPLSLQAVENPRLKKILNAHVDAMGGWRAWSKVESLRLTGTIERDGTEVDFCIIKKRPDQIRATITMPIPGKEEEFIQLIRAHDGKNAWTATRLAGGQELNKKPLDGAAAQELLDEATVLPKLIHMWQKGARLSLDPTTDEKGADHHKIIAEFRDKSSKTHFWLSKENFRLYKYKTYRDGSLTNTTFLSGYIEENDILLPRTVKIQSHQTGDTKMSISMVDVGIGIYDEYFAKTDK